MNLDLLLSFVQAPHKMADHSVSDLEDMVAEYPYFSAAQMLLLKQYKLQNSSKFNKQLRHSAGVLPDRKQLYRLIEIWPEEVEQVIEAESSVTIVPAQAAAPAVELDALAAPAEVSELAAPLSEVPLQQLEEVQGLSVEKKSALEETEQPPSENDFIANSIKITETPVSEVVPIVADESTDQEVISAVESMRSEQESKTDVTEAAENLAVAISQEEGLQALEMTPLVEEWPVMPEVEPEVVDTAGIRSVEASAVDDAVFNLELPAVEEMPSQTSLAIEEIQPYLPEKVETVVATEVSPAVDQPEVLPAATAYATSSHAGNPAVLPIPPQEVAAFIAQPHARLSWFKFFAGKPLREQSDEVLDQLYLEHMQQDLLRAPDQDQQISAIRAQINREAEVPSSKALEEEIRRLAYESISDDELPASETLAGIYAAQHDYKKAIRIYQKLILKFPDKMSYFARLIEELREKS